MEMRMMAAVCSRALVASCSGVGSGGMPMVSGVRLDARAGAGLFAVEKIK